MPENHFGERVAERFDERYAHKADPAVVNPIVDFLEARARGGAALEFGVGTGRVALPLAQRGVTVHGIDLSQAMTKRLRAKPDADRVGVTIGEFATTAVERGFSLVYIVANTIMNLTTQDERWPVSETPQPTWSQVGASWSRCSYRDCSGFPQARPFNRSPSGRRTLASTSTTSSGRA